MDNLIVDVYAGDCDGKPDWPKLVSAGPPWCGAIIKATDGIHYAPPWFSANWPAIRLMAGERYGRDFLRGCYHYLKFNQGGAAQADFYLDFVERAGGWGDGDMLPIVDVERANNGNPTAKQVVDVVSAFTKRIKERTGRECMLYGGSLLYDLGIHERMGCSKLWIARYTATLPRIVYERIGWSLTDLAMWQYCGDGTAELDKHPHESPLGRTDISAAVNGLQSLTDHLLRKGEPLVADEGCAELPRAVARYVPKT